MHSEEQIRNAKDNLDRCLSALEEHGEEGLQRELDRMYPGTTNPTESIDHNGILSTS